MSSGMVVFASRMFSDVYLVIYWCIPSVYWCIPSDVYLVIYWCIPSTPSGVRLVVYAYRCTDVCLVVYWCTPSGVLVLPVVYWCTPSGVLVNT